MKYIFTCLLALMAFSISAQKLGRPVAFDSIQYVSSQELAAGNDAPAYFDLGDELVIEGIVCQMHPGFYGLSQNRKSTMVFSKSGSGMWSGIEVMATGSDLESVLKTTKFYDNFQPGFTVRFKGKLSDFGGNTQVELSMEETEVIDLNPTVIEPVTVTVDMFKNAKGEDQYISGEPYEHAYVEFKDVIVVDREMLNPPDESRWIWAVQDKNGNKISIRDYSGYFRTDDNTAYPIEDNDWVPPAEGSVLDFIKGVIVQTSFDGGGYMIAPLVPSDIQIGIVVPLVSNFKTTPTIPESSDDIKVSATITDDGTISSAELKYAAGLESTDWKTVNMSNIGGDDWEASIGKHPDGTLLKMFIEAKDNEGNLGTGPSAGSLGFVVKVIDGGLRRISDIQVTPLESGASIFDGRKLDNISISGIVTSTTKDLGITAIQEGLSPYSGIFLKSQPGDNLEALEPGDVVTITAASVEEEWSVTYLTDLTYTKAEGVGVPNPLKDIRYSIFDSGSDSAEAYEGMYMEWTDVVAVDTFPDIGEYGEWTFGKDTLEGTPTLRVDDLSDFVPVNFAHDSLVPGQELGFIRGIMYYSHEEWKLLPRTLLDIDNWGFVEKDTSSINEVDASINLRVFPNPAKDQLVIAFEEESGKLVNVQIVDVTGKVLFEDRIAAGQNQFDVQHLRKGMYIIKLVSPDWSTSKQFIKE